MKTLTVCIGHIAPRRIDCINCANDNYNQYCQSYIPITIKEFSVQESHSEEALFLHNLRKELLERIEEI